MLATYGVAMLCALVAASARPAVERPPLKKEPAYQSKSPRYALLVFGPQASKRLWVVLDEDRLFVDRDGDGDLTEVGEQFRARVSDGGPVWPVNVGAVPADGKAYFSNLTFSFKRPWSLEEPLEQPVSFSIAARDSVRFAPSPAQARFDLKAFAHGTLSKTPKDAPIIWYDGPLEMRLQWPEGHALVRGREQELGVSIGTSVSEGAERALSIDELPADVHPVVEIQFPNREGGKPLVARYTLKERC